QILIGLIVVLGAVDADPRTVAVHAPAGDGAGDGGVGQDGHVDGRIIRVVAAGPNGGEGVGIAAPLVTEVLQGFPGIGQSGPLAVDEDIGVVVYVDGDTVYPNGTEVGLVPFNSDPGQLLVGIGVDGDGNLGNLVVLLVEGQGHADGVHIVKESLKIIRGPGILLVQVGLSLRCVGILVQLDDQFIPVV